MTVSITQLYDLLSVKVGKDTAQTLTTYIEEKIKNELIDQSRILATKEDVVAIKDDIAKVRENAANMKSEIIKWMFIFWLGQIAATFGFILLFLRK